MIHNVCDGEHVCIIIVVRKKETKGNKRKQATISKRLSRRGEPQTHRFIVLVERPQAIFHVIMLDVFAQVIVLDRRMQMGTMAPELDEQQQRNPYGEHADGYRSNAEMPLILRRLTIHAEIVHEHLPSATFNTSVLRHVPWH